MSVGTLLQNQFVMVGQLYLIATDKDGNVKAVRKKVWNHILNQGEDILVHGLFSGAGYTCRYLGLGSGANFVTADTGLTGEGTAVIVNTAAGTTRVTMAFGHDGSGSCGATMIATAEFGAAWTVLQAGIFVHSDFTNNTNSIFAKATFASIALACTDKLTVKWFFSLHCTQE